MRKLGWYVVSAVVAAIILGGVLLLAGNLYVQSMSVQGQIHRALVSNLKMAVEIKKTTVTPWEGLRIDGIAMRPENAAEDFLTADSFRVQFALLPLFHKRLVVQQILLDRPELAWAQSADGRWRFPPDASPGKSAPVQEEMPAVPTAPGDKAPPADSSPDSPTPPIVGATPYAVSPTPAARAPDAPDHRYTRLSVAVEKLKLRHGILNFLDYHRRPVARFEEVNLDTKVAGTEHANGALWFGKAILPRAGFTLSNFHSDFTYDEQGLYLHDGSGQLAGGKINLDYHMGIQEPGSPFSATCHVENVSLGELIIQAGGPPNFASGRLRGDIKAWKSSGGQESRQASGQIQLVDARFANLPLLQSIGDALHIEDISHLQFKKAQIDWVLDGTTMHIQPLVLVSNDLQITAQGDYRLEDDRMALRARLTIDRAVGRQLPQFIESNFQPCGDEAPGSRYMDFDITGTPKKPKSDLFSKVLQGSANNLLENLFAPKKKHEKKAPKHDENSEPPTDQANGSADGT